MKKKALVIFRHRREVIPYEAALRRAGVEPVLRMPKPTVSLDNVSGLLLTGGEDIDPGLYGETRIPESDEPDGERDTAELRLIAQALKQDMPLLAICRGLQILNVQHGGTLIQHLGTDRHQKRPPDKAQPAHQVKITPGTLLSDIARTDVWDVNSRHHQAVNRVGNGLVVSARDPEDGTIEALERPDRRFVLALQWHPENQALVNSEQLKLFQRFENEL